MKETLPDYTDSRPPSDDKKRVVVAMSGGVDSSVAAALLVQQGYEVIGMMMRLWSEPSSTQSQKLNRCCTPDQMADARRVAQHLGIPFYVIDAQEFFYDAVVRYFVDEHVAGRTPNPCIECNRRVRFSFLLDKAMSFQADYLATGHYARVKWDGHDYQLLRAHDHNKDQSYVLHVLGQEELSHVLFPVGDYTKSTIRQLARQMNLPVAEKSESMDLCFLSDGNYRRFLKDVLGHEIRPGPIVNQAGAVLGQHQGLTNYTIGQRKGLGIAVGKPQYVLAKDEAENTLIVGDADSLGRSKLVVKNVNWLAGIGQTDTVSVQVKIRYKASAVPAVVAPLEHDRAQVCFAHPVAGATAGQGAVFYVGDVCLGGGIIDQIIADEG